MKKLLAVATLLTALAPLLIMMAKSLQDNGKFRAEVQGGFKAVRAAQNQYSETLDLKFSPIEKGLEKLERDLGINSANIEALEITATQGTDASARLLAGRIKLLQEQMLTLQKAQSDAAGAASEKLEYLQMELHSLELAVARVDTVFAATVDTVIIKNDQGRLRRLLPF